MSIATPVNFEVPDETRTPDRTRIEVIKTPPGNVARLTLEPGWSWRDCIQPVVGGKSCQNPHLGYVERGALQVSPDSGEEQMTFRAGDIYAISPGHQAQVIGDEPFVGYEFESSTAKSYGRPLNAVTKAWSQRPAMPRWLTGLLASLGVVAFLRRRSSMSSSKPSSSSSRSRRSAARQVAWVQVGTGRRK